MFDANGKHFKFISRYEKYHFVCFWHYLVTSKTVLICIHPANMPILVGFITIRSLQSLKSMSAVSMTNFWYIVYSNIGWFRRCLLWWIQLLTSSFSCCPIPHWITSDIQWFSLRKMIFKLWSSKCLSFWQTQCCYLRVRTWNTLSFTFLGGLLQLLQTNKWHKSPTRTHMRPRTCPHTRTHLHEYICPN